MFNYFKQENKEKIVNSAVDLAVLLNRIPQCWGREAAFETNKSKFEIQLPAPGATKVCIPLHSINI